MVRKPANINAPTTQKSEAPQFHARFALPRSLGWRLVVALGCTTILSYGTTQYLFGVLVVPLSATFSWSRADISGANALSLLIAGLLGLPVGYLVAQAETRENTSGCHTLAGGSQKIALLYSIVMI